MIHEAVRTVSHAHDSFHVIVMRMKESTRKVVDCPSCHASTPLFISLLIGFSKGFRYVAPPSCSASCIIPWRIIPHAYVWPDTG